MTSCLFIIDETFFQYVVCLKCRRKMSSEAWRWNGQYRLYCAKGWILNLEISADDKLMYFFWSYFSQIAALILGEPQRTAWRLWSDCAYRQIDLSLCWTCHMYISTMFHHICIIIFTNSLLCIFNFSYLALMINNNFSIATKPVACSWNI